MDVAAEIRRRLEANRRIEFALLFGSRANGNRARTDSDWDVALYVDPSVSARERFELRLALAADLEELGAVDVVILNDVPPLLAHRALQGRQLFVRNRQSFVRFFVKTLARSEDERPMRELHDRERRRRLEEGRFGRP